jgi:ubiquinone/menaquinone biosynthesis C-methylase UbiE
MTRASPAKGARQVVPRGSDFQPDRRDFDAVASDFDRLRALPEAAAQAIRSTVLDAIATPTRARLLDLGAGSGRIGWPFVRAGDDYVGVDVSSAMLQAFAKRREIGNKAALVQADGCALPFAAATFDAVLLVQVFGGLKTWRALLDEARRVLRKGGMLMLGRTLTATDGIDSRMKLQLASLLGERTVPGEPGNVREQAEHYLAVNASSTTLIEAARWSATRTPRGFIDRHSAGARFSRLPFKLRTDALRELGDWAVAQFGSLDASFPETHWFELRLHRFAER